MQGPRLWEHAENGITPSMADKKADFSWVLHDITESLNEAAFLVTRALVVGEKVHVLYCLYQFTWHFLLCAAKSNTTYRVRQMPKFLKRLGNYWDVGR